MNQSVGLSSEEITHWRRTDHESGAQSRIDICDQSVCAARLVAVLNQPRFELAAVETDLKPTIQAKVFNAAYLSIQPLSSIALARGSCPRPSLPCAPERLGISKARPCGSLHQDQNSSLRRPPLMTTLNESSVSSINAAESSSNWRGRPVIVCFAGKRLSLRRLKCVDVTTSD